MTARAYLSALAVALAVKRKYFFLASLLIPLFVCYSGGNLTSYCDTKRQYILDGGGAYEERTRD
jgi:hypothetical protein